MSIATIGLDIAKSVFQVHGIDGDGEVALCRKLQRSELMPSFTKLAPCTVTMEACGAAHHWARVLGGLGHEVRLIAPEAVRPFVKRSKKNDAVDAAAICAAASRPEAHFVPVKSVEQQGGHALHAAQGLREAADDAGRTPRAGWRRSSALSSRRGWAGSRTWRRW